MCLLREDKFVWTDADAPADSRLYALDNDAVIMMPQTRREYASFAKAFHPTLNFVIWWEKRYGCNNWRKMHGLPMDRRRARLRTMFLK